MKGTLRIFQKELHQAFRAFDHMPVQLRGLIILGAIVVLLGIPGTISYVAGQAEIKSAKNQAIVLPATPTPTVATEDALLTITPTVATKIASVSKAPTVTPTAVPTAKPTTAATAPTATPVPATPTPTPVTFALTSISPSSGPAATKVTISGKGFGSTKGEIIFCPNQCDAGGYPDSWTDTEIKTTVPFTITLAKSVPFYIRTATGATSNRLEFTITAGQPIIDSISPGNARPADEVVLKGINFSANPGSIQFTNTYGSYDKVGEGQIVSWSDTEIKLKFPSSLKYATEYGIQVISGGGAPSSLKYYRTAYVDGSMPPLLSN